MRRVLLVETRHGDLYRHHRAEYFPYVQGLVRRAGGASRWCVLRVPDQARGLVALARLDLPPAERALVLAELRAFAPDVILFHDRPADGLVAWLTAERPGLAVVDLDACVPVTEEGHTAYRSVYAQVPADVLRPLVGLPAAGDGTLLLDAAAPDFERHVLGDPAALPRPPVRLALASRCLYRRSVSGNPAYAGVAFADHYGCAFCPKDDRPADVFRQPTLELALAQIAAHLASALPFEGPPFEYLLEDSLLSVQLPALWDAVLARGLGPLVLHTMVRADVLLSLQGFLEGLLPRLRDGGHGLRLLSMGAESFSEVENQRFNKGVTTAELWQAFGLVRDLEARFPGTFACPDEGVFSAIVFTPWTTLDDLRANLRAARRLGPGWLRRALGTRLQLWPGLPITELARRDGLLGSDGPGALDDVVGRCWSSPDQREVAWRFADPRTARAHALLVRLPPVPEQGAFAAGDPLLAEAHVLVRRLAPSVAADPVGLALALVDAIDALGPDAPAEALFRRAFGPALREAASGGTAARGGTDPDRVGALTFTVAGGPDDDPYVFHVARARPGRGAFRTVGSLILFYTHAAMTPGAEAAAGLLVEVMGLLSDGALRQSDLPRWREAVDQRLSAPGAAARTTWSVTWRPD